jgi:hypothetical protein
VSPDPPENHQGTAAPHARPAATAGQSGEPEAAEIREFFTALAARSPRWLLTVRQRTRLAAAVAAALAAGWTPARLAEFAGANTAGVRNPCAVLAARLSSAELPPPPACRAGPAVPRPPWCGTCDETTRMLGWDGNAPRPCPRCKTPGQKKGQADGDAG